MNPSKSYSRHEDMSPDGELTLYMQRDGDIIIIIKKKDEHSHPKELDLEFCCSGGKSPHTRKALFALAAAIEKDNMEN